MSEVDHRAFYRDYIDLLNARELERVASMLHDELTYFDQPVDPTQVVASLQGHVRAVPDIRWEVRSLLVDGDRLAASLVCTGTPVATWLGVAPTGRSFEIDEYAVYELRDGRFAHMTNVYDADTLRAQVSG